MQRLLFWHTDFGAYVSISDVPEFSDRHKPCLHPSSHGTWFELYFEGNDRVRTTGMSHEKKNRNYNKFKNKTQTYVKKNNYILENDVLIFFISDQD